VRKLIVILTCLALSPALLAAQDLDPHFEAPRIAPVAHRSAFLHGYLHGYEEGFHQGDFDLQMGRFEHGDYVANGSPKGYRRDFGPKQMYKSGFHEGFAVGYSDAAAGRSFRAIQNVIAATSTAAADEVKVETSGYDGGMRLGYLAGQHQGLADARRELQAHPSPACPVGGGQADFCTAYAEGFQMGYSDGFANQAKTTLAAK
jgi:hypothetical protein